MKKNFIGLHLVVFLLSTAVSLAAQASLQCNVVFLKNGDAVAPKSANYYLKEVERLTSPHDPAFIDPKAEIEMVSLWKGTKNVPKAIRESLLDNTALIDFPLLAADAGTIKQASGGGFVSFRLNETWRDKNMSTNVGMHIDSIISRKLEGSDKLIPSNAKAAFIFLHGGGTKTTGHHVATALANFMANFGVAVISLDAPWHAYGPRVDIKPVEYYEYLRDFRHKYIPADVPTFIGGHSYGGMHADNIMRLSDKPEYGFHEAFKGLVNLSGPMDSAPGRPQAEKDLAEEAINTNWDLMKLVPEGERDLNILLLTQGKSSALSGLSAGLVGSMTNWVKPEHGGKDYIPTLAMMGERDALYIGREKIWEEHMDALSNVTPVLMGLKPSFKTDENGDYIMTWVSHMIFDHYISKNNPIPETFNTIKDWMEIQLGGPLETTKHMLPEGYEPSKTGLFVNVMTEYYTNLAFRIFADRFPHVNKKADSRIKALGQHSGALKKEYGPLKKELGQLMKTREDQTRIAEINSRMREIEAENEAILAKQKSTYVPSEPGPLRDFAVANVEARQELGKSIVANQAELNAVYKELTAQRRELSRVQKQSDVWKKRVMDRGPGKNERLQMANAKMELAFNEMVDLQMKMNEANAELTRENVENGTYAVNPNAEIVALNRALDASYADYNKAEREYELAIESELARGYYGEDAAQVALTLWGSVRALETREASPGSLLAMVDTLVSKAEALEIRNSNLINQDTVLLSEYLDRVTPGFYNLEVTTIGKELERPFEEVIQDTSNIQRIWKAWKEVWGHRPPQESTTLY